MSLLRSTYYTLSWIVSPLLIPYLSWRIQKGHEDKTRLQERFGKSKVKKPHKPLLWVNAVSVGEAMAALTIIQTIQKQYPGIHVLLTTTTPTSAKVVSQRLPKHVTHQFSPIDTPQAVTSFLNHWQPDLAIWIESELWPNLLHETQSRGIPTLLLNGRISSKSFKNWKKLKNLISPLLSRLELCAVQSEEQAAYFNQLGANNVCVMGNAKLLMPPLPVDETKLKELKKAIANRPLWLAASTQPGEDEIVLKAHQLLLKEFPDLLTIIVPRHIERSEFLKTQAHQMGFSASLRTEKKPLKDIQIYIGNTLGEMGLFYALSPVVLIGATLIPKGGHNPIEASQMGAFVLHGPHVFNNPQLYHTLNSLSLSQSVQNERDIAAFVSSKLEQHKESYDEPDPLKSYRTKGIEQLMKLLNPHLKYLNEIRE
jgi:3-deoxy-D-manno-octulosonic-acid transferase